MNDRIRALWDKAAESTAAYTSGQNNSWQTQVNFVEKFTELIVQECAGIVEEHQPRYLTRGQAHEMANTIKEHFGVEE